MRAERSRALTVWWVVLHGLIGASVLTLPVAPAIEVLGAALLLAHAWRRRPRQVRHLLLFSNDYWALLDCNRFALRAAAGTVYTAFWLRLVLTDENGGTVAVLLLRDQFAAEAWRKIQVAVRECDNVSGCLAVGPPV